MSAIRWASTTLSVTYALVAAQAVVILMLLAALLYGQPASQQGDRYRMSSDATVIAQLRAPTVTPIVRSK